MKVLITGAAGRVGGILRPAFETEHECRFFDLIIPPIADHRWIRGDLLKETDIVQAVAGMEAVVHLTMGNVHSAQAMYDVNVKGMHLLLDAAVAAGVQRVVYASTMSVYRDDVGEYGDEETRAPNAIGTYGLTKRLSEQVAETFARRHPDLSFIALRLYGPVTEEEWATLPPGSCRTAPNDLRRAFLCAVSCRHKGFDAVFIATDLQQKWMRLGKAERLLGWKPRGN
jgi:nucleoside-diphosphate-sugar epimerase